MSSNNITISLKLKLKNAGEVKGDEAGEKHKEEIRINRFSWGFATETATVVGKSIVVQVLDFEFTMRMSKASPIIMAAGVKGDQVVEATLSLRQANSKSQEDYLVFKLSDGVISNFRTEASVDDMTPTEWFTIRFRKFNVDYRPYKDDTTLGGVISGNFDVANLGSSSGGGGGGLGPGASR